MAEKNISMAVKNTAIDILYFTQKKRKNSVFHIKQNR